MQGGHIIDVGGKSVLRLPKLVLQQFVVLGNGVKAAVQAGDLLRQFAHFRAMVHVPLLQGLGMLFLELGYQCRQVCSFIHTGWHVSAFPQNLLGSF